MRRYGCVFLALAVFLGLAVQVQATSYDPTNLVAPTAQNLVRMNQGGMGDALIGDFYRATVGEDFGGLLDSSNFLTYVSITNTSNDYVAAHVRLRSGRYSIEIVDFPIMLSPHDVFWFQFLPIAGTDPVTGKEVLVGLELWSTDLETIKKSGLPITKGPDGKEEWRAKLSTTVLDDFSRLPADEKTVKEMAIGYMEVIGLWRVASNVPNLNYEKLLADVNFYDLMRAFFSDGFYRIEPNNASFRVFPADLGNVLAGQVFMGDFSNGLYTGYSMTALADFRSSCTAVRHRDRQIRGVGPWMQFTGEGPIVYLPISDGFDPAYRDPDWATSFGPTLNDGDDWTTVAAPVVATVPLSVQSYSLDEVDDALAKATISSTYFNGGFRDDPTTFTMSVMTFPTKYLHVGFRFAPTYPATAFTFWPVGRPNEASIERGRMDVANVVGQVKAYSGIFNLEEEFPFDPYSPQSLLPLKYEVNCLPIGASSYDKLKGFCFLTHSDKELINVEYPTWFAGWFGLRGFGLMAGAGNSDPRAADANYNRASLPLLRCLALRPDAAQVGYDNLIPVLSQTLDWEFGSELPGTVYLPHARAFAPSFDNPNTCAAPAVARPACPNSPARF